MIKYYACEDGFIEKLEPAPNLWIRVESPDETDSRMLTEELGVPESFLENLADEDERPRFEREKGWLLTIMRVPVKSVISDAVYDTVPFGVITKDEIIITLCNRPTDIITDFIDHTRKRHIQIFSKPDFILRLLYSATYWFLKFLKEINQTVDASVVDLERSVRNEDLINIMQLQKALVFFNTSLQGNSMLLDRLDKLFDDTDQELLEDVSIEMQQANNTVNIYMEILDSTMDTFASIVSNNVNQIMKRMTSVTIILMLPTLVASFYGMNVAVKFGESPNAFWYIIVFSFILAGLIYFWLRKIKWF